MSQQQEEEEASLSLVSKLKGTNIELDFDSIKSRLKEFLSGQDQFQDYDFESSGMSVLLDLLAYNTQMNAMTAHLSLNELYLDSAQARPNIVSLAKQIGYLPGSVSSAIATINVTAAPTIIFPSDTATLKQNTAFQGGGFDWYVIDSVTAQKGANGSFFFPNVNIREGTRKVVRYYYDGRIDYPKFEIPDRDVNVNSIKVRVKESESSEVYTSYTRFVDFSSINNRSAVFFIDENALGLYEIYFSGGVLGINPESGNIIEIDYVYSNGSAANGVNTFAKREAIVSSTENVSVSTIVAASGGGDKESVESIRFNAPYYFQAQNRCVSVDDYASIVKSHVNQVDTINVWGGEQNFPPDYGKVFLAIKPKEGFFLSESVKDYIKETVIKPRRVSSVIPVIVDADYSSVVLDVVSKYDETRTSLDSEGLAEKIRASVQRFNDSTLNQFNSVFRYSRLVSAIDGADPSITSSSVRAYLLKTRFLGSESNNGFITVVPTPFYDFDLDDRLLKTNLFIYDGKQQYIVDRTDPDAPTTKRILSIVYIDDVGNEITSFDKVGEIDLQGQTITVYDVRPDVSTYLKLYINPKSYDIVSYQNQIINIDLNESFITVQKDYNRSTPPSTGPVRFDVPSRNVNLFEN